MECFRDTGVCKDVTVCYHTSTSTIAMIGSYNDNGTKTPVVQ